MALAAATGGELRIRDAEPDDLLMIRRQFRRLGLESRSRASDVLVPPEQRLRVRTDVGDAIPKIEDGPWPAFPADLTSIALALATQADGDDPDLREDVREPPLLRRQARRDGRSDHALRPPQGDRQRSEPASRRARREPRHPRRHGDAHRRLAADGISEIGNVRQIDRGYERIDERLRDLGAQIERVSCRRYRA